MTQPIKVNGRLGAFLDTTLKLWPILALLIGWAVSVEIRIAAVPTEIPPPWFVAEVDDLKSAVAAVDETVGRNSEALAAIERELELQRMRPPFSDGG